MSSEEEGGMGFTKGKKNEPDGEAIHRLEGKINNSQTTERKKDMHLNFLNVNKVCQTQFKAFSI